MAAHVGYLAAQPPLALRRVGGLARLGAAVRRSGPSARATPSTSSPTPTSRTTPSLLAATARYRCSSRSATTSTGRARCATPSRRSSRAAATPRSSRATRRSGRCASRTDARGTGRDDGRVQGLLQGRPGVRHRPHRPSSRASGPTTLIGRPENHMTGVSFARGGYHRIGKRVTNGAGGYTIHRPDHWLFEGTGLGYGDLLGAGATRRRLRVRRLRLHLPRRAARTPPAPTARPPTSRSSAPRRPPHFTRDDRAPARPRRTSRPRSSSSPSRLFGTREPERRRAHRPRPRRARHLHVAGGRHRRHVGCTDWAHGLAGRDPQVEQITRNLLDRLG